MMRNKRKQYKTNGSALILVVVVTVLLAVIGVMFLMTSRVSEMETVAVTDQRDVNAAVETVIGRIHEVLVADLFGGDNDIINAEIANLDADEQWDYSLGYDSSPAGFNLNTVIDPGPNGTYNEAINNDDIWLPGNLDDFWLASLGPVWLDAGPDGLTGTPATMQDDTYAWPHITDLWGTIEGYDNSLFYQQYDSTDHNQFFQQNPAAKQWVDPDDINNATNAFNGWSIPPLWDRWQVSAYNVRAKIIAPRDRMQVVAVGNNIDADIDGGVQNYPDPWEDATYISMHGARADADGDGVADSRWVQIPGLTTSRGKPVFAAVRIIDNCAMLNLNAAHCFYQTAMTDNISPFELPWQVCNYNIGVQWDLGLYHDNTNGSGRFLTEINYFPFLRGHDLNGNIFSGTNAGDNWSNLMDARSMTNFGDIYDPVLMATYTNQNIPFLPAGSHNFLMDLETPADNRQYFDISDELEMRNRYLVSSLVEARIEQNNAANYTLDANGGTYAVLETPVDDNAAFNSWKIKVDPINFDEWDLAGNLLPVINPLYRYDRRHVCTLYSYDRNIRRGQYPLLDSEIAAHMAIIPVLPVNFSSWGQYEDYLWDIFTPEEAVTTNIEDPEAAQPYNNIETRKRILHLLYALREYYLPANYFTLIPAEQAIEKNTAALKAVQVTANIIDFSDDDAANTNTIGETQGPFYNGINIALAINNPINIPGYVINYGVQANANNTFITRNVIRQMLIEVSQPMLGIGNEIDWNIATYAPFEFGMGPNAAIVANDIVYGYERQPFISEVYVEWDGSLLPPAAHMMGFAVELLNPYDTPIDIVGWTLEVGTAINHTFTASIANPVTTVPAYNAATGPGRFIVQINSTGSVPGGTFGYNITPINWTTLENELDINGANVVLSKPAPSGTGNLCVDGVDNADVQEILGYSGPFVGPGDNALKRDENDWKFVQAEYIVQRDYNGTYVDTFGLPNGVNILGLDGFQLAVPDNGYPLSRWHDLEVLSLYSNEVNSGDPNDMITEKLVNSANVPYYYDLAGTSGDLLDYLCTMNRPEEGTLPGRININTAPMHVIAAAIPPKLADDNVGTPIPVTFSALQMASAVVEYRQSNGPYERLSDLLNIWVDLNSNGIQDLNENVFQRYYTNGLSQAVNTGQQSINDDIEERDWILSHLANKFTVRSDVFTAYILVRLGEDGSQRRMIAIFDRSNVSEPNDRPRLVALHPVPDPR